MRFCTRLLKTVPAAAAVATAIFSASVAVTTTSSEASDEVAIRCDNRGCSRIYCDETGDRCFRVDDWRYDGRPYRFAGGNWYGPDYYDGYDTYNAAYAYYGRGYRKHRRYRRSYRRPYYEGPGPYAYAPYVSNRRCKQCDDDAGYAPYYGW